MLLGLLGMTRILARGLFPLLVLLLVSAAAASCNGDDGEIDLTAGEISDSQLPLMLLTLDDFGPDFADFQDDEDTGFVTAAERADDDFDPEDEAEDLERFGWSAGYYQAYLSPQAEEARSGLYAGSSDVYLFETADGASGYLEDSMAELAALPGESMGAFTVEETGQFDADVADEAVGFHFDGSVQADDGSQFSLYYAGVIFRRGRLLPTVGIVSFDDRDTEEQVKDLADVLDQRIVEVLEGKVEGEQEPEPMVVREGAVLATSAERFSQDVQTMQGTFESTTTVDDFRVDSKGEFAFRSPDRMYMKMDVMGETVEYLMVFPDTYMRFPHEGWYVLSGEAIGVDREVWKEYMDNRGLVDYVGITEQMKDVTRLPDGTIAGVTYLHYRGTLDPADAVADIPEGLYDQAILEETQALLRPMSVELWLDEQTYLPRRVDMEMTIDVEESRVSVEMSMEFVEYDQPVAMPEPPTDAEPFGFGTVLGLRCSCATKFLRERYDLPVGKGCVVLRVDANSAAEQAGFQIGDRIIRLDGSPITSGRQFSFRFEQLPGPEGARRQFVVQRGDQALTLPVVLGLRADPPEDDPYFYYLRAKADTAMENRVQVLADYTRAIELEPAFELPYLYRGVAQIDREPEAAKADILKALELDPELAEGYWWLAQIPRREGDFAGALESVNRSIELHGCGRHIESWDLDCGEALITRARLYELRLDPGDDLLAEADSKAAADVILLEPWVALSEFDLAYVRGDDRKARRLGEQLQWVAPNVLFSEFAGTQGAIQRMLDRDTFVLDYALLSWFYYTDLREPEPAVPHAENEYVTDWPGVELYAEPPSVLSYQVLIPGLKGGETVSWELRREPYRLGSSEETNPFGEMFQIQFGAWHHVPAGRYDLDVYVDGQKALTTSLDVP